MFLQGRCFLFLGLLAFSIVVVTPVAGDSLSPSGDDEAAGATSKRPAVDDRFVVLLEWQHGERSAGEAPVQVHGHVEILGIRNGRPVEEDGVVVPVVAGEMARVSLPLDGPQFLRFVFDDWLAPGQIVNVPSEPGSRILPIRLWPTARLMLRAVDATGVRPKPLTQLSLRIESGRSDAARSELSGLTIGCQPIPPEELQNLGGEEGWFRCPFPVESDRPTDFSLRPEGFVPRYRWGYEVRVSSELNLGAIRFERGSSIAGWVFRRDGDHLDTTRLRLSLEPVVPSGTRPKIVASLLERVPKPVVERDGFFLFEAVEPGSYRLFFELPGLASLRTLPLVAYEGAETRVEEPFYLEARFPITARIDPPLDVFDQPWRVELHRHGTGGLPEENQEAPRVAVTATPEGVAVFPNQMSGELSVLVFDSLGRGLISHPLAVRDANSAETEIKISSVPVGGQVVRGGEPFPAYLWFGGKDRVPQMDLSTDDEGRFEGFLPRRGSWRVVVEGKESALSLSMFVVAADEEIVLEIPAGRVFGLVRDHFGLPFAAARVNASCREDQISHEETSANDGSFSVEAMPSGPCDLMVRGLSNGSVLEAQLSLDLGEGASVGPLDIVLEPHRKVRGRVVDGEESIPGAKVRLISSDPGRPGSFSVIADRNGEFSASLPAGVESMHGVVMLPGLRVQPVAARWTLHSDGLQRSDSELKEATPRVTFDIPRHGATGTLELRAPEGLRNGFSVHWDRGGKLPNYLWQDWLRLSATLGPEELLDLMPAFFERGEPLVLPRVATGPYELCTEAGGEGLRCVGGYLPAGGTLVLDLATLEP